MKYCCVFSTTPDIKKARKLAGLLISRKLAACVQLVPKIESHYRWKGKKEISAEVLLVIKTCASLYPRLEKLILQNHPYKVPELIAFPIAKGNKAYLDWLCGEVKTC